MQQYADIYLLQSHSTCICKRSLRYRSYIGTATSLQRDLIRPDQVT